MSSKKSIDTLVKDIYKLFDEGNDRKPKPHDLNKFAESVKDAVLTYLTEKQFNLRCPLDSEYSIGTTWKETH